jgi:hypothetical protein
MIYLMFEVVMSSSPSKRQDARQSSDIAAKGGEDMACCMRYKWSVVRATLALYPNTDVFTIFSGANSKDLSYTASYTSSTSTPSFYHLFENYPGLLADTGSLDKAPM